MALEWFGEETRSQNATGFYRKVKGRMEAEAADEQETEDEAGEEATYPCQGNSSLASYDHIYN